MKKVRITVRNGKPVVDIENMTGASCETLARPFAVRIAGVLGLSADNLSAKRKPEFDDEPLAENNLQGDTLAN